MIAKFLKIVEGEKVQELARKHELSFAEAINALLMLAFESNELSDAISAIVSVDRPKLSVPRKKRSANGCSRCKGVEIVTEAASEAASE